MNKREALTIIYMEILFIIGYAVAFFLRPDSLFLVIILNMSLVSYCIIKDITEYLYYKGGSDKFWDGSWSIPVDHKYVMLTSSIVNTLVIILLILPLIILIVEVIIIIANFLDFIMDWYMDRRPLKLKLKYRVHKNLKRSI